MKVTQAFEILNNVAKQVIGQTDITTINATNLVDIGNQFDNLEKLDKYVNALINHIGKVIFDTRIYYGQAPSVFMDSTEYGSIVEKIRMDVPEAKENRSWALTDGLDYGDHTFYQPKVHAKFFNEMDTWEIRMSFGYVQVKQSFSNASQLTAFYTMIENKIRTAMTIRSESMVMTCISNMIAGTIYSEYKGDDNLGSSSGIRAINLLYEFKQKNPNVTITASNCLNNLDFLKYAAFRMKMISDHMTRANSLFNVGSTVKFTPKELQRIVMLSEFATAADVYLQSDTFHNEFTKLPNADIVSFWQGSGTNFSFDSTSDIHLNIKSPDNDGSTVEMAVSGILGTIFDREALGVTNVNERVRTVDVPNAEFYTNFYKKDGRYFNDYDENFVVFFVA